MNEKYRIKGIEKIYNSFKNDDIELIGDYCGTNKPITIKCNKCGRIFEYTMAKTFFDLARRRNYLCDCAKQLEEMPKNVQKFINDFKDNYSEKYEIIQWFIKYKSEEEIVLKCKECGCFKRIKPRHYNEKDWICHRCNKTGARITYEELKNRVEKSEKYSLISKEFKTSKDKVLIRCEKCGFIFKKRIDTFFHDELIKCPKCNPNKSNGELKIMNYLIDNGIEYIDEFVLPNKQRFDFYIPSFNIAIEYNGRQHYEEVEFFNKNSSFEKIKKYDENKKHYCEENNIKLLIIPYTEYENIDTILDKVFND